MAAVRPLKKVLVSKNPAFDIIPRKRQIRVVPKTSSLQFSRVFLLDKTLVGFHSHGVFPVHKWEVALVPVGKTSSSWAAFEGGARIMAVGKTRKPILARAHLKYLKSPVSDPEIPRRVCRRLEGKNAAEVSYEILWEYRGVGIQPNLLRKGIGTHLLNELEQKARRAGVDVLVAAVYDENTASRTLLSKNGFIQLTRGSTVWYYKELE